jgi:nucleoside-triphosphatase THEP1
MRHNIYFITGVKQIGKTTSLLHAITHSHTTCKGILTPIVNGKRHIYNIERNTYTNIETLNANNYTIGKFSFDKDIIDEHAMLLVDWALEPQTQCIIIDEIGPLELVHYKGFYNALLALLQGGKPLHLVLVIRPSLLHKMITLCEPYATTWQVLHKHDILNIVRNIC